MQSGFFFEVNASPHQRRGDGGGAAKLAVHLVNLPESLKVLKTAEFSSSFLFSILFWKGD